MGLKQDTDYVLVKTAARLLPGMVMETGNLVVTRNHVIFNVIQEVDLKKMDQHSTSIKGAIQDMKEAVSDLKQNMKDIKSLKRGAEMVNYIASSAASEDAFAEEVAEMGASSANSLHIRRSEVKEFKIGFFKGFQVHKNDGSVVKIRTGSLGALKKITA